MSRLKAHSPSFAIFLRMASTAALKHLDCRVRKCRRAGKCLGAFGWAGLPLCGRGMTPDAIEEMLNFLSRTARLATPEMLETCLAAARDDADRAMILFERKIFLSYMKALENAGLAAPIGLPFIHERPGLSSIPVLSPGTP